MKKNKLILWGIRGYDERGFYNTAYCFHSKSEAQGELDTLLSEGVYDERAYIAKLVVEINNKKERDNTQNGRGN